MCDLELQLNCILYQNQDENQNKSSLSKGWPSWGVPSLNGSHSSESEPSPQEIKELLALLSFEFPKGKAKSVIKRLYNHIIKQSGNQTLQKIVQKSQLTTEEPNPIEFIPPQSFDSSLTQIEIIQRNIDLVQSVIISDPFSQIQYYHCQSAIKASLSRQQQRREETRQSIALVFCYFGYGHQAYCDYQHRCRQSTQIKRNKYAMLARSVINDTFQRIEQYLKCFTEITTNKGDQIAHSFQFLHHFNNTLQPDDKQTFLSAVQKTFKLKETPITLKSVAFLYVAVQQFIKKKLEEHEANQKFILELDKSNSQPQDQPVKRLAPTPRKKSFIARMSKQSFTRQLQKIWNDGMDMELINFFIKDCSFSNMREHFRQRYKQHSVLFNSISLRAHFQKVVRLALRKLRSCLDSMGSKTPKMIWLNDKRIKYIMLSESEEVVQELFKMYTENFTKEQLEKIVNAINIFVAKKDAEYQHKGFTRESIQEKSKEENVFSNQQNEISVEQHEKEAKRTKSLFVGQTYKSMSTRSSSKVIHEADNSSSYEQQNVSKKVTSHCK